MDRISSYSAYSFQLDKKRAIRFVWVVIILISIFSLVSNNSLLVFTGLLLLPVITSFFWRPGEPSVFLFAVLFLWISITIKVFYSLIIGVPFEELFEFRDHIVQAYYLNLYGLVGFILGIYFVFRKTPSRLKEFEEEILKFRTGRVIIFYLLYNLIIIFLFRFRFVIPGLFQGIVALNQIKLGLIFFLFYLSLRKREFRFLVLILFAFEFVRGFVSFFANFKEVAIILFMTYVAYRKHFTQKQIIYAVIFAFIAFQLGIIWTAVKSDFRMFLSGGERAQRIVVSNEEAFFKMVELLGDYDQSRNAEVVEALVDRVSYIDYFSASMNYIPAVQPHENGKVWYDAVMHILQPRLFFPNKPSIDDSQHLMNYTGIFVADASMGTSISLGFMGDSYVDFGGAFLVFPVFLLGLLIGWIFKNILQNTRSPVWAYVLVIPIYEMTYNLGVSAKKMIGVLVMFFLVALLFRKFVAPRIDGFLKR